MAEITQKLLDWYREHGRDLPWRRTRDPYAVWVSEMMLQQTQVSTVVPYYERWLARFPTVQALAAADEQDVLHAWQGLGYYRRARNLRLGAQEVVSRFGGAFPNDVDGLRSLPGIGPYTAGAIASIAFQRQAAVVDGNVIRVLTRLYGLSGDPARSPLQTELWRRAQALVPQTAPGDFNQALMELGATLCTPKAPRCPACPIANECVALAEGQPEAYPQKPAGPSVTHVRMGAAIVRRDERVLLVQRRHDEARWPGMWQFPAAEAHGTESEAAAAVRAVRETVGLSVTAAARVALVRHSVTRFRIAMQAFQCEVHAGESSALCCADLRWVTAAALADYPMPVAHQRIAAALLLPGETNGTLPFDEK